MQEDVLAEWDQHILVKVGCGFIVSVKTRDIAVAASSFKNVSVLASERWCCVVEPSMKVTNAWKQTVSKGSDDRIQHYFQSKELS